MSKNHEKSLVFAAVLSVLVAALDVYLSRRTGLLIFPALVPFSVVAAIICGLVFVRLRLARLSTAELRDEKRARIERPDESLFGDDAGDDAPLTMERSRQQFERYVVPVVTVLLGVGQAIYAWLLYKNIKLAAPSALSQDELLATTFLLGQGFILFLFSRYLTGLGRENRLRLYRGPGITTGVAALASFAAAIVALLATGFQERAILIGAYVLTGLLLLLAAETLLMFIVAIYSPQRKFLTGVAYESRLANFLTDPRRMAHNVAQTVDYQFGLDVSQNWYARVLKTTLVPLIATAGIILYGLSSFVLLGPEEQGILERYGRPVDAGWQLDSGLHIKKPWPFETVTRIPAKRLLSVNLGFVPDEAVDAHNERGRDDVLVWSKRHYKEESRFLVYNPLETGADGEAVNSGGATLVGFLNANIPLQYEVKDLKAYAYNYADPQEVVEKTATRVVTQEMATHTLRELLVADRSLISDNLKQRIQDAFDTMELGVEVRFIGIYSLHPPVETASAYQGVVDALAEKEKTILEARTYTEKILPQARAERETLIQNSTAYMVERKALASAEAAHFEARLEAYKQGGEVFKMRERLAAVSRGLEGVRKFVVDSNDGNEVINFKGSGGLSVPEMLIDEEAKRNR